MEQDPLDININDGEDFGHSHDTSFSSQNEVNQSDEDDSPNGEPKKGKIKIKYQKHDF